MADIQGVPDEELAARIGTRATRLLRVIARHAPASVITGEQQLLSEAAFDWLQRHPYHPHKAVDGG